VNSNFSHSPYATLTVAFDDNYFSLAPQEVRTVDFNITLSDIASGNFAGIVSIIGQVNNSETDLNIQKNVVVSVESFIAQSNLSIYPKTTSFSIASNTSSTKNFSVCNISSNDISSITWAKDGNGVGSNNASTWFTLPSISSLSAFSCSDFSLLISVPAGTWPGEHDANFTATSSDLNSFSSNLVINVTS
jgi:uncharacterized membrane protein